MWDNPGRQLPGTGILGDGGNLYGAQGVSGTSSGSAHAGASSSGGPSLQVSVSGSGSGGASLSGQASACAGEDRPSLFSDSGNSFSSFNPFSQAMASMTPLGSNSEVTDAEVSTTQLPLTLSGSGCFITTSGKCLHAADCHHGKRAEVKTLQVKICTECLSNDIRRLPHTSEVYLDWNDCVHQSRVCEGFHRRRSHLSEYAVKRIVKKCWHCF